MTENNLYTTLHCAWVKTKSDQTAQYPKLFSVGDQYRSANLCIAIRWQVGAAPREPKKIKLERNGKVIDDQDRVVFEVMFG